MLVEDDEGNRIVARALLQRLGIEVGIAESGREAVAAVSDSRFDLVLMDVRMPEMDGYQAAAEIRRHERLAKLPIIALTAGTKADERQRCLAAGMSDYLSKPIGPEELEKTLAKWLGPESKGDLEHTPSGETQTPTAEAKSALPEALPGLDLKTALARIAGEETLYLSLLERFRAKRSDVPRCIAEALKRKDTKTARQLAHTLTGTAATIGAEDLATAASAVERAIERGACEADGLLLDELSEALATLLRSISRVL